jgi:hypothetical protein
MDDYQALWQAQKDWLQEQIGHCKEEQEKYMQLYQELGKDSELGGEIHATVSRVRQRF